MINLIRMVFGMGSTRVNATNRAERRRSKRG
jgi:hypothetical protein